MTVLNATELYTQMWLRGQTLYVFFTMIFLNGARTITYTWLGGLGLNLTLYKKINSK